VRRVGASRLRAQAPGGTPPRVDPSRLGPHSKHARRNARSADPPPPGPRRPTNARSYQHAVLPTYRPANPPMRAKRASSHVRPRREGRAWAASASGDGVRAHCAVRASSAVRGGKNLHALASRQAPARAHRPRSRSPPDATSSRGHERAALPREKQQKRRPSRKTPPFLRSTRTRETTCACAS
jgi:hypothetical protein